MESLNVTHGVWVAFGEELTRCRVSKNPVHLSIRSEVMRTFRRFAA